MQIKIFLTSLLATFLAVSVTATPVGNKARDVKTGRAVEFSTVATSLGGVKPFPNGQVITPKDKDVPVASTSVKSRDLESLEKRTAGCIFVTQEHNWSGTQLHLCIATNGGCTGWGNNWRYTISSFGPDEGTTCEIFTDENCAGGGSVPFSKPGYSDLGRWNDNMASFRCWW